MDKCQAKLLKEGTIGFVSSGGEERVVFDEGFTFFENEDSAIGDYRLVIRNPHVRAVQYLEEEAYEALNGVTSVPFDFAKVGEELVIYFVDDEAAPVALSIKVVLADKEGAEAKVKAKYQKKAALEIATGINLLNVFWKKANETVTKSVVKVEYIAKKGVRYPVLEKEMEAYYLSIPDLAFGTYEVSVEEFADLRSVVLVKETITLANHPSEIKKAIKKGK